MKNLIIGFLSGILIGLAIANGVFTSKGKSARSQVYIDDLLLEELNYYRSVCEQKI